MAIRLLSEPEDAEAELNLFGLSTSVVHEKVIQRALSSGAEVDPLSPPGAVSRRMYDESVAGLRSHLIPSGYEIHQLDNVARTVDARRGVAIVCARGNGFTGVAAGSRELSTEWRKGPAAFNRAALHEPVGLDSLGTVDFGAALRNASTSDWKLWYLLSRRDGNKVRVELSSPTYLDSRHFPTGWDNRIILPPYELPADSIDVDIDEGPEGLIPDVPVFEL